MILHLFPDEKFIDLTIDNFEAVSPLRNKYLIGIKNENYKLKYVKKHLDKIFVAPYGSQQYYAFMGNLLEYEAVVLHYLDAPKIEIVNRAPKGVNFVWNAWGGDIYNELSEWHYTLYGKATAKILTKVYSKNKVDFYIRSSAVFSIYKRMRAQLSIFIKSKAISRIKYYSTVLPPEKQIIERFFKINANYITFNYFSDLFNSINYNKFKTFNTKEGNILLGNSAAPTNNHMEALDILAGFKTEGIKIIMPLSYGGTSIYNQKIKDHGKKLFGEFLVPLDSIMPESEYYNLLSSCSVCVMNHYRQNGMGNVMFMIWIGSKVFLSERNLAYCFLKELGLSVFSIERDLIDKRKISVFDALSEHEKAVNKKIVEEQYGYESIMKRISNFVSVITENAA